MGIKTEITKGLARKTLASTMVPFLLNETQQLIMDRWPEPSRWVRFKRILPPKQKFFDRIIDMQTFFIEITNKEPTKLIMGWKQRQELDEELRDLRMVMMPHKGWAGKLLGMNVFFVLEDSKLEVTC